MNVSPRLIILGLAIFLSGCATAQTSARLSDAKAQYDTTLEKSNPGFTFTLIRTKGISKEELLKKSDAVNNAIEKTCAKDLKENLIDAVNDAAKDAKAGNQKSIKALPKVAENLQGEFKSCAKDLGAKANFFIEMADGSRLSAKAWIKELLKKAQEYANVKAQADVERNQSASNVGKALTVAIVVVGVVALAAAAGRNSGGYSAPSSSSTSSRPYPGNCQYSWQIAADGSSCGNRAASVRPGGY